jgi:hypothetical protein
MYVCVFGKDSPLLTLAAALREFMQQIASSPQGQMMVRVLLIWPSSYLQPSPPPPPPLT